MSYITTYTGKHFDPVHPLAELIDIRDIAHALSLMTRGNGHLKTFFSVGQHCLNCAREAEERGHSSRIILACLIHDASEAYMSDVPRPFKPFLPQYLELEDQLLDIIYTKYLGSPLTKEEEKILKDIDDDMLYYDLKILLNEPSDREAPDLKITLDYTVVPFEHTENAYLALYNKYKLTKEDD